MNATTGQMSVHSAGRLIAAAFDATLASRLSKHARLYDAISNAIESDVFVPGQKLPGERELCEVTGLSLGTVQKGLSQLMADGRISREHGRGTFVRPKLRPLTDLWHYRFRDPATRDLLPVFAQLAERAQVLGDPVVVQALGEDRARYVRVCRILSIGDRFRCWSEIHLPFSRFGGLMDLPEDELASVNLKQVLATRFNAPTLATTQTVVARPIDSKVASLIGAKPRSTGLLLQIVGTSRAGIPITFQRIHVPPSDCEMEVGVNAHSTVSEAAA